MKTRSVSKSAARSVAMQETKAWTTGRVTTSSWLKRIATCFLAVFAQNEKTEERDGLALGDQVELPPEFLETIAQSPSPDMGKRR